MQFVLLARTVLFFCFSFVFRVCVLFRFLVFGCTIDCLKRLVSEMTCYVSSVALLLAMFCILHFINPTLTHSIAFVLGGETRANIGGEVE